MKSCFFLVVIGLSIMTNQSQAVGKLGNGVGISLQSSSDTVGKSWFNKNTRSYSRQGNFYLQAGFNWSAYGRSDINFDGPGYDFTLEDIRAHDEPYKLSIQYNIHAGYFIKDKYSISLGFDHMKYVMRTPQQVQISGIIESQVSNPAFSSGPYAGEYNDQEITVTPELLTLEYTDGLNVLNAHFQRYDDVWIANNRRTSLALETGVAAGIVIPRSEVSLFGVGMNNKFNIAGWTASAKAGLMFNFNKSFYFLANLEAGYANMDKIFTTGRNDIDKASQKINFLQTTYFFGLRF
jgi:hypothetical protein